MFQPLHGAVETLGVGGADHITHVDLPGAVDVDGVVGAEGVPGVGTAVVGHDAAQPVHGAQVQAVLFDLKTVSVQFATSLKYFQVTVPLDVQVMEDEEDNLFLIDFVIYWCLDSLL